MAGTLHEVSNALTVVLGWLETASQGDLDATTREALEVAREHARRGRVLAREAIGDHSESLRQERHAQALAEFAMTSVVPQANARGVTLDVRSEHGAEAVIGSETAVLQILTNLMLNAIDFSPRGGSVMLGVRREGSDVVFSVTDQGRGVPEERRRTLFSDPESTRPGGVGIGLPYSRRLARDHGGDLRLVPSPRGASFELTWPADRATALRPSMPAPKGAMLSGQRLLIVEDDPAISSLLELSLEARGAEVVMVDGVEALGNVLAGRLNLDAILLDLSPLEGCLASTLDRLKDVFPSAPIVLVSGQPGGVPAEAEGRFQAWVRKPFEMDELVAAIGALVATEA